MALHVIRKYYTTLCFKRILLSSVSVLRCFESKYLPRKAFATSIYKEKDLANAETDEKIRRIYVGNLLKGQDCTTEDKVFEYFSQFGKIDSLEFFRDQFTKLPRGFAFVTFSDAESAEEVLTLARTNYHSIDGHKVSVQIPLRSTAQRVLDKRGKTVLVDGISKETSKEEIAKHFSQFGKVERVILAKEDVADKNKNSYYVMFASVSGAKQAQEQSIQKVANQDIDSCVTDLPKGDGLQSRKHTKRINNCISVTSVPSRLTIEDLQNYFQKYGDVHTVDFIVNGGFVSCSLKEDSNVAFVRFSDFAQVNEILQNENHVIAGSVVKVLPYKGRSNFMPEEHRKLKLSVEGLPLSAKPKAIQEYIERTFSIVPNGVFLNKHQALIQKKVVCILRLSNIKEVEHILQQQNGTFNGHPVYFRRLFWKKAEKE
ncbi:uncharacterized protein [Montipora foliosa]|uniref:uncharacterized protein n=1 Tax=Montipora foliosa TaxID=591990 RepID=UPI0035F1FD3F